MKEIYNELQMIYEFESNFNPTKKSKDRKNELLNKLAKLGLRYWETSGFYCQKIK